MRRTLVLALTALALLGAVATDAFAQAPAGGPVPKFTITGFVDEVMTYSRNVSNVDADMHLIDKQWYGRTRGRFDIIGEYGKSKVVLGLELDFVYGQAGSQNTNIVTTYGGVSSAGGASAIATQFGTDGGGSLNTDVRGILEIKWLYTEFEAPLIPWPTVIRLGLQPDGTAASYKLATYFNGDFSGVNVVSTLTPNVKLVWTYVAVEEALVGQQVNQNCPVATGTTSGIRTCGVNPFQLRGDDWAFIMAPEITPFKGLDIKPMWSYFTANGTTSVNARQGRGGINTTTGFANADGSWKPGINENRYTVGVDGRLRMGAFSFDPSILYQFGNRDVVVPVTLSGPLTNTGKTAGQTAYASESSWLIDMRAGYQIGPLLLEMMYMWTQGNRAGDTTLRNVHYFQPLSTDTSYLADWGGQLMMLGVDYLNAMLESGLTLQYPGVTIGWDKYGRQMLGGRATYAFTPALSAYFGANYHLTSNEVDKNSIPVAGGGLLPSRDRPGGDSQSPAQQCGGQGRDPGNHIEPVFPHVHHFTPLSMTLRDCGTN